MVAKFCVYAHRKKTDGSVFYIGKGSKKRARSNNGRSNYWHRIATKYGRTVHIIKDGMMECCAFSFERALIHAHGRENLCNMTNGGEGCSGRKMSESQRERASKMLSGKPLPRETVQAARMKNFKPVGTRCGLRFPSVTDAAKFVKPDTPYSAKISISLAANGGMKHSYGYEWGFVVSGDPVFLYRPAQVKKPVKTECGLVFDSGVDAERWLRENGHPKAINSNIVQCCKGRVKTAYGYRWSYV